MGNTSICCQSGSQKTQRDKTQDNARFSQLGVNETLIPQEKIFNKST